MSKPALIFLTTLTLLVISTPKVAAEITAGLPAAAISLPIDDTGVSAGQIVTVDLSGKYTITHKEYDPNLVGVTVDTAALSLEGTGDTGNAWLVISSGQTKVLVSAENGAINVGDFITSGNTAGYGMKAVKPGITIGQALTAFGSDNDPSGRGGVILDVRPQFFPGVLSGKNTEFFTMLGSSILALFGKNQLAFLEQSAKVVKSIIAALIALIAIFLSFVNFGRVARSGIEASGRNPLAGKLITASITLNIALTIVAGVFGVALAYLIFVI